MLGAGRMTPDLCVAWSTLLLLRSDAQISPLLHYAHYNPTSETGDKRRRGAAWDGSGGRGDHEAVAVPA